MNAFNLHYYSYFEDYGLITDNEEDKAFQNLINHCNAYNNLEKVRCLKEMLLDLIGVETQ